MKVNVPLSWVRSVSNYPFRYGYVSATLSFLISRLENGDIPTPDELVSLRARLKAVDNGGPMIYDGIQGEKTNNVTTEKKET